MTKKGTKKTILVTGASGFVGRNLVPYLLDKGYSVIALDKAKIDRDRNSRLKVITADLSKPGKWQEQIKDADILVHLAAQISSKNPGDFDKNNVAATVNLVDALKNSQVKKIIHFSSAAVTSIRKDKYASTKETQEKLIKKSGKNYVMLRPSMMYGPTDDKNIGWLIRMIKKYPVIPLPGGGNFGRQPVYIGDVCQIVGKLITGRYPKKIYEIHGNEYVTMKQMVKVIIRAEKLKKVVMPIPNSWLFWTFFIGERVLPNPKFTSDQILSLTSGEKFKGDKWWKVFNVTPTTFEVGVHRMIDR